MANGFMCIVSRSQKTPRSSSNASAARRLTRRNEEEGGTGPVGAGAERATMAKGELLCSRLLPYQ